MAGNCDATNGAGLSNAPTPGWDSSADCSFAMNICSQPTGPPSISPASGSHRGNVYETRSSLSSHTSSTTKRGSCMAHAAAALGWFYRLFIAGRLT